MKVSSFYECHYCDLLNRIEFYFIAAPKTKIAILSTDTLELSVTKTFLDVLQDLGKAFSDAIRPGGLTKPELIAPYIVENETGFDITLNLKNGDLNLHSAHFPSIDGSNSDASAHGVVFQAPASGEFDPNEVTSCKISPGGKAYLQAKRPASMTVISAFNSLNDDSDKAISLYVQVSVSELNPIPI